MKVNFPGQLSLVALALSLTLFSCSKDNDSPAENTEAIALTRTSMEADAEGEVLFDDVFNNVMGTPNAGLGGSGVFEVNNEANPGTLQTECFTLQFERLNEPDSFPLRVTIDFGSAGCTGRDGRIRKGKIITVYTNRIIRPGAVAETSFDNYYVNDIRVEGTHRLENKSTSSQLAFETKVTDGKLTRANGDYATWSRTRVITQTDGWGTPWVPGDDVYQIVGNGQGSVHRGDQSATWTSTNLEPLVKKITCKWIVSGKQQFQRNGGPGGVLNFGNGDCDNKATLTVEGKTVEITLK